MKPGATTGRSRSTPSDARLVAACLAGDEAAWVALVERYERLVFAIAGDYGGDPSDVADLFQAIWFEVHNDLPSLRQPAAFKAWLVSLANRRCYRWKQRRERRRGVEVEGIEEASLEDLSAHDPRLIERLERDQLVRQAVEKLPDRCRELIRLLFFTLPPRPYKQVAAQLGLAVGSIGFIRGRCLDKLRRALVALGVE